MSDVEDVDEDPRADAPASAVATEAVIRLAVERADRSGWGARFETADVAQAVDGHASTRTVRRALQLAAAQGWVKERFRRGEYEPGPRAEQVAGTADD